MISVENQSQSHRPFFFRWIPIVWVESWSWNLKLHALLGWWFETVTCETVKLWNFCFSARYLFCFVSQFCFQPRIWQGAALSSPESMWRRRNVFVVEQLAKENLGDVGVFRFGHDGTYRRGDCQGHQFFRHTRRQGTGIERAWTYRLGGFSLPQATNCLGTFDRGLAICPMLHASWFCQILGIITVLLWDHGLQAEVSPAVCAASFGAGFVMTGWW